MCHFEGNVQCLVVQPDHFRETDKRNCFVTESTILFRCYITFFFPEGIKNADKGSGIEKPTQLVVSAEVKETGSKNQWNIWVYPAKQETVDKQPYITSALDNQAMAQLEKGENVLLLLSPGSILPEKGGNISVGFSSIFWNTGKKQH